MNNDKVGDTVASSDRPFDVGAAATANSRQFNWGQSRDYVDLVNRTHGLAETMTFANVANAVRMS